MAGTIMPSSFGTRHDVEYAQNQRQQALLDELLAQEKMKTRLQDPLEKAHMEATVRNFEKRTGVQELGGGDFIDAPKPQPMRTINRGSVDGMPSASAGESARDFLTRTVPQFGSSPREVQNLGLHGDTGEPPTGRENVTTQFGTSPQTRTIRRFGSNSTPTDPDAAMGVEARAKLHPSVLSSEIDAKSRLETANIDAKSRVDTANANAKPAAAEGPSSYATETASRTVSAIDALLNGGKINAMTAGPLGRAASFIPGTDAANVSADLETVTANVAFNALQAMRDASKTGGALGSIAARELDLLASVQGSVRQSQSPANLKKNLTLIKESQQRFLDAAKAQGGGSAHTVGETKTFPNGKTGVWDGTGWAAQ
jgi:hypothetical protein